MWKPSPDGMTVVAGMRNANTVTTMRALRAIVAAAGALALPSAQVHPQTPARLPAAVRGDAALQGEYAMEQETRERWMHGRQLPRFTPFTSNRSWIFVDSLRDSAAGRRIHLTLGRSAYGRDSALIVVDATGRITRLQVGLAPFARQGPGYPGDSTRWLAWRRGVREGGISLTETRVWDLAPTFPPSASRAGLRWADTLARVATIGSFRQSMRGTRISRMLGDTVVDGRLLWIVHDSASVQYEERYVERERTLDTTVQVSRSGAGTVRGVHLYDPQLRLFRWRADTTRLAGSAVLRYPDGRSFRTPARYERVRRWGLYDVSRYAARLAVLRTERDFGGMVIVPGNELERRLGAGDAATRDSVIRAWQRTADPDEAAGLFRLLTMWVRDEPSRARIDSVRIASGDTAYHYDLLARRAFITGRPLVSADVRAMLRFMEDPSIAWGLDKSRDRLYENLVQALTTWPRAVPPSPYGRSEMCTVDACRLLGAQWRTAREPRLRDVGLVALATLDPRQWADTVLALDGARHPLLHPAALLAKGVGATWPAASKAPLPAPNSDWHAWLEWMNGRDRRYDAVGHGGAASSAAPEVRFEESHWTAIRFFEARTRRDVVEELRRGYDAAGSDSARLVFGTMLQHFGEVRLTEAQVAEAFLSGVPARIQLAREALLHGFNSAASAPMNAAAAAPFIDRLLAVTVDSAPLWRVGAADLLTPPRGARPIVHAEVRRIFLNGDSLPDALRARWQGRLEIIASAEWDRRDVRSAAVFYTVRPLRAWGRFVRIEVLDSERIARPDGQLPAQYAAGNTYYLMELNGEWVIVAEEGWVT